MIHVEGDVNPVRDLEIISEELRLKDEEMLEKNLEKLERTVVRGGDKKMKPEYVSDILPEDYKNYHVPPCITKSAIGTIF